MKVQIMLGYTLLLFAGAISAGSAMPQTDRNGLPISLVQRQVLGKLEEAEFARFTFNEEVERISSSDQLLSPVQKTILKWRVSRPQVSAE